MQDEATLRTRAEELATVPWHHSIRLFPDLLIKGSKSEALLAAERAAILDPLALDGRSVLDIGSWNGYLLPLLVMAAGGMPQELWTLPLGVQQFSTQYSQDTGAVLAYTSLSMVPALVFFLAAERRIVGGLTGAVKG